MGGRVCKVMAIGFLVLYAAALALLAIGTFGLFGAEKDPLAGIFLMPLGLPWNLMLENAPDSMLPWLGALSPALNLVLILGICRVISRRRS